MSDSSTTRVVWPFAPNWAKDYTVSYEFKTDLFTSDDGSEQRRALRSTPRKTLKYTVLAANDDLRTFNRLVDTVQNQPIVMPEVTRWVSTTAAVGAQDTALPVDGTPAWLISGSEVILSDHANGYRLAKVTGVVGSTITLNELPGAREVGTKVHPALTGLLTQRLTAKRTTNIVAEADVQFAVDPTSEAYSATIASVQFSGTEVLEINPNWASGVDASHEWPLEQVDFGRGQISTFRAVSFPTTARVYDIVGTDADAIVGFYLRMHGQQGSFLMSTREIDFIATGNVAGSVITVIGTDAYYSYRSDPVRSIIEVCCESVGSFYTSVTGMTMNGGNTDITLGNPLPAIDLGQISRISWVTLSRLATDTLETVFTTTRAVRTKINVRTLPSAVAQSADALRVTVDAAIRDTIAGDNRAVIYV